MLSALSPLRRIPPQSQPLLILLQTPLCLTRVQFYLPNHTYRSKPSNEPSTKTMANSSDGLMTEGTITSGGKKVRRSCPNPTCWTQILDIDHQSGTLPTEYVCRICGSKEVSPLRRRMVSDLTYLQHRITECPERSKPPEGYVCKRCQQTDHFIRDCPTKDERGDTGGRKPPPGYVCRACASEAHLIDDCPVVAQGRQGREPRRGKGPAKEISGR